MSGEGRRFLKNTADETFNRVARKLAEGVKIKNIGGYCYEVARLVCLEAFKGHDNKRSPLEAIDLETTASSTNEEALEKEMRLSCLDDCLRGLPDESRELILQYYRDDSRSRIDHRKALAQRRRTAARRAGQPGPEDS